MTPSPHNTLTLEVDEFRLQTGEPVYMAHSALYPQLRVTSTVSHTEAVRCYMAALNEMLNPDPDYDCSGEDTRTGESLDTSAAPATNLSPSHLVN